MPSLIGPTNIPPWEAFKMNKPVIYSELNGIKEVLGDSVHYINPMNSSEIANSIKKIFEDSNYRKNLVEKGSLKLKKNMSENNFSSFFKIIENYRKYQKTWVL